MRVYPLLGSCVDYITYRMVVVLILYELALIENHTTVIIQHAIVERLIMVDELHLRILKILD